MRRDRSGVKHVKAVCGACIAAAVVGACGKIIYITAGGEAVGRGAGVNILLETVILLLMSAALSLELRCGGLDFSLGAVAVLSSSICAYIFSGSYVISVLLSVFFGAAAGLLSGAVRVISRLSCALCSLCMCLIYEGLAFIARGGNKTYFAIGEVGYADALRLLSVGVMLTVILYIAVRKTAWGAGYRAMSKNRKTAELCGVDIRLCEIITHIISGGLMGGAGALLCIREGRLIEAGLSFSSVRILFFGLLPLLWGRLYSYLTGDAVGDLLGVICSAGLYCMLRSVTRGMDGVSAENITAIASGALLLIFLAFLSNRRSFFGKIRTTCGRLKKN